MQTVTREIGIDAAHRVPEHHSKCRNLHGHRYTIQATCAGALEEAGSSAGMVLDFGFLKEEMMAEIDAPCDHGLIYYAGDPVLWKLCPPACALSTFQQAFAKDGYWSGLADNSLFKLYIVPFVPTAENLARHWFGRLASKVLTRGSGRLKLVKVRVLETPNCWADYTPEQENGNA